MSAATVSHQEMDGRYPRVLDFSLLCQLALDHGALHLDGEQGAHTCNVHLCQHSKVRRQLWAARNCCKAQRGRSPLRLGLLHLRSTNTSLRNNMLYPFLESRSFSLVSISCVNCPALTINNMKTTQALNPNMFPTIIHFIPNCRRVKTKELGHYRYSKQ